MFMLAVVGLGVAGVAYAAALRHVVKAEAALDKAEAAFASLREGYVRRACSVMPDSDPNQPRPAPPAPMRRAGIEVPYSENR